ncbi:hypothetical protein CC80DRAFT_563738 [Byssothecium circinans]|uniref:RING-type domain-containing protein n=1 Tax=Byssothecium circinans TaxID=147558 RepID=A0A6A5U438_9PLEO|nr:hypothetical protein CC80DRAFT_563738 [Byssothecium circinans]
MADLQPPGRPALHPLADRSVAEGPYPPGTDDCGICDEDFAFRNDNADCEGSDPVVQLPCGHAFHQACVLQWMLLPSNICPTCRAVIFPQVNLAERGRYRSADEPARPLPATPIAAPVTRTAAHPADNRSASEILAELAILSAPAEPSTLRFPLSSRAIADNREILAITADLANNGADPPERGLQDEFYNGDWGFLRIDRQIQAVLLRIHLRETERIARMRDVEERNEQTRHLRRMLDLFHFQRDMLLPPGILAARRINAPALQLPANFPAADAEEFNAALEHWAFLRTALIAPELHKAPELICGLYRRQTELTLAPYEPTGADLLEREHFKDSQYQQWRAARERHPDFLRSPPAEPLRPDQFYEWHVSLSPNSELVQSACLRQINAYLRENHNRDPYDHVRGLWEEFANMDWPQLLQCFGGPENMRTPYLLRPTPPMRPLRGTVPLRNQTRRLL